tara:strand:+ start:499 stop:681 length:183 start_codon:yes stop_codon:yes gene_type:complete
MRFLTIKCKPTAKDDLDMLGLNYSTEDNYLSLNYCEVDNIEDDEVIAELELNPDDILSIS